MWQVTTDKKVDDRVLQFSCMTIAHCLGLPLPQNVILPANHLTTAYQHIAAQLFVLKSRGWVYRMNSYISNIPPMLREAADPEKFQVSGYAYENVTYAIIQVITSATNIIEAGAMVLKAGNGGQANFHRLIRTTASTPLEDELRRIRTGIPTNHSHAVTLNTCKIRLNEFLSREQPAFIMITQEAAVPIINSQWRSKLRRMKNLSLEEKCGLASGWLALQVAKSAKEEVEARRCNPTFHANFDPFKLSCYLETTKNNAWLTNFMGYDCVHFHLNELSFRLRLPIVHRLAPAPIPRPLPIYPTLGRISESQTSTTAPVPHLVPARERLSFSIDNIL